MVSAFPKSHTGQGVEPISQQKGRFMKQEKAQLIFRMEPATREKIERWYQADGCRSRNEFLEKAVNFYADHLELNGGNSLLPTAIQSVLDGRLGLLEQKLSALLFKQTVEMDMMTTLADAGFQLDESTLRRLRVDNVNRVKHTNGRLSLEQKVREREDDERWQD